MFNECMCQGFLRRCRLRVSIFQTRICNGETTGVEWFVFISAICVTFKKWSLRVYVHRCKGLWSHLYWCLRLSVCICKRKLKTVFCQEGSSAVEAIWKLPCWTGLSVQLLMCCSLFILSCLLACLLAYLISSFSCRDWRRESFTMNKFWFLLLHGTSFAFLRFCVGPRNCSLLVNLLLHKCILYGLWMTQPHRIAAPLMSVPKGSVK